MGKVFDYARILHAWQIRKSPVLDYVPEDISIELTNTCNFKCSFCPQSDPRHFETVARTMLNAERADVLLAKLRAGGVKTDVMHWTLDGEPFANKGIDAICAAAIARGWRHFIFSTNGYFCTPDRLRQLPISAGAAYTLCIDFCADRELFERHRGTPHSWQKVKDNIDRVTTYATLAHVSLEVTDISSFAIEDPLDLRRRFEDLKNLFPASERVRFGSRIFHNATGFVAGVLEKKRRSTERYNLCPYPWSSMVIASNGDVVACCRDLQHKTVLGNLFREDLKSIWNGEAYQGLRRELAAGNPQAMKACAGCDLPYDSGKFTLRHMLNTAVVRLGVFK